MKVNLQIFLRIYVGIPGIFSEVNDRKVVQFGGKKVNTMERTAAKIPNFVKNFNYFLKDSPDESIKSITSHVRSFIFVINEVLTNYLVFPAHKIFRQKFRKTCFDFHQGKIDDGGSHQTFHWSQLQPETSGHIPDMYDCWISTWKTPTNWRTAIISDRNKCYSKNDHCRIIGETNYDFWNTKTHSDSFSNFMIFQHKWCDAIPLERIPRTYSTIVAATQDAINVLSHITNESCFSFVTSNLDEVPKIVVELFYGKSVDATLKDVEELLLKLHIK